MSIGRRLFRVALFSIIIAGLDPSPAWAGSSEALLRLLQVLRDRGSISAAEYDELRALAEAPGATPEARTRGAVTPAATSAAADVDNRPAPKAWYDKLSLRGYTQFRFTETQQPSHGPAVDVPADRSVSAAESFVIRRGRFVLSGDAAPRLSLYAQADFNASTGASDFSLQMRDLYADVAIDDAKAFRIRLGQSKVPFGFVNLQSSQNRAPMERPDALNSAVEGERDYGAYLMWASPEARRRFRDLVSRGLKGSGDYGVIAVGAFNGQGLNRSDQDGDPHWLARASYPFALPRGQMLELGAQAYHGRFLSAVQSLTSRDVTFTPTRDARGVIDQRVAATAVLYPQPVGFEAEWTFGRGPELSADLRSIAARRLHGGYVQVHYRHTGSKGTWLPFTRWHYYDGGRKFARNAPSTRVNELDLGVEVARWAELELTMSYTHTFARTRTGSFPHDVARGGRRVGFQAQWNY